jgi:hypothetical protein
MVSYLSKQEEATIKNTPFFFWHIKDEQEECFFLLKTTVAFVAGFQARFKFYFLILTFGQSTKT